MAGKTSVTLSLRIDGLKQTLQAFNRLEKDANTALREASFALSQLLASRVQSAAQAEGAQAVLLAPTVKAMRDRAPFIQAGGTRRVGRNKVPAFKVLFGSEFGSNQLRQFKPHRGRLGYWAFPTVEANQAEISAKWNEAADDLLRKFEGGA